MPTVTGNERWTTSGAAAGSTQASHQSRSMNELSVVTKRFSIIRKY